METPEFLEEPEEDVIMTTVFSHGLKLKEDLKTSWSLPCTEDGLSQVVDLLFQIDAKGAKCGWQKDEEVPLPSI